MYRHRKSSRSSNENQGLSSHLRWRLLSTVIEFMNLSGASASEIRDSFEKVLAELGRQRRKSSTQPSQCRIGGINLSAELLRLWHRDDRFTDQDANPKPLYLNRGANSLRQAVKQIDPEADAEELLHAMKAVGLIRPAHGGRYLPTTEAAIIGELHPIAVEHVAKTVIHLVSTACRNTDPTRRSMPLIERFAHVPDLNPSERKAFAEFTRVQGMAYLESVDDWLQQRRVRRVPTSQGLSKTGVAASVHLVAYLDDEPRPKSAKPRLDRSQKPRLKPPPEARA